MKTTAAIYTDIDSILDTRMALLYLKFPDTLKWLLANGYPHRLSDIPNYEIRDDFITEWGLRNRDILVESRVTKISRFVKEFIESSISQIGIVPDAGAPRVILNLYPYEIKEQEGMVILKGLMASIGSMAELKVVNLKPEEVSPSWIDKQGVQRLLVYRYDEWIKPMITPVTKPGAPMANMISPRIIFDHPGEALIEADSKIMELDKNMSTMKIIEQSARPIINLDLITPDHFSIDFADP